MNSHHFADGNWVFDVLLGTHVRESKRKNEFSFVFFSLNRTFGLTDLRYSRSEMKIKSLFYFEFLSLNRTFVIK